MRRAGYVTGQLLRFSRYRFQGTFRQRRGAYLSLVLLIGLVGGLSMGALAAARRTESSFPTFLASTNPSNLSLGTALWNPALGYTTGYNGPLVATIARLPHVRRAESYSAIYSVPIGANGQPTAAAEKANMNVDGSVDGLYLQPGPGHGRAGTDGRPEAGQRDHDDRGCRRRPGPPRRADRHLGHLHQRPVRVDGERTSATGAAREAHPRRDRRPQQRRRAGRDRCQRPHDRHPHAGPHAAAGQLLRQLLVHLPAARPGQPRRAGGRGGDRACHPVQTPLRLLRHLHRRHQGPERHQARGHRPRRVRPHRRAGRDPHRGSGDRPAIGFLGSGGAHPAAPSAPTRS